jgi:hypothetical protein
MNAAFLHHLTLHFPIVLTLIWAVVGVWSLLGDETPTHRTLIRWGGWITLALVTITVVSGLFAAPGWFGGEASEGLRDHRNLGLTTWCVILIATIGYHIGDTKEARPFRVFGIGIWLVAVFSVVGTGHWGGSELHPEPVPWLESDEEASETHQPRPADPGADDATRQRDR